MSRKNWPPAPPPGIAKVIQDNGITSKEAEAMLVGECYRLENVK